MKNKNAWKPSKYVYRKGRLRASKNLSDLKAGSRLASELVAVLYDAYIPQYAAGRLVDLGCGKAPLYEAYSRYVAENICVDWENSVHRNEYSDFACDLTRPLPFRDAEFQTVVLSDVLEHLPQPEKLWQELHRILSAGGKVLMNVPFYYPLHEEPHDYYRYSEYALRRFAREANFKVLVLKPIGGSPEIMADLCAKHLEFVPLVGRWLAIAIQYAAYVFIKTSWGRTISAKTSAKLPFGYFLVAERI